nr:low temperature requirement protein A [Kineococcus vitellinus]
MVAPLTGRDPAQADRTVSPLELFYDLVSVVAVALAAEGLENSIAAGHPAQAVSRFALVFFALYLAWANFTWFASAYDDDDVLFRLLTFLSMTGALVLAAGVPAVLEDADLRVGVGGYVLMRLALVLQWSRVVRGDPLRRLAARRFVVGLSAVQVGWLAALLLPSPRSSTWLVWSLLAVAELALPVWAQWRTSTPWHARHLRERYGLFMIIVLGESVLAGSRAVQSALGDASVAAMTPTFVGGLLLLFCLWWLYFERPDDHLGSSRWWPFAWSYLYLFLFASVAAVGAGLSLVIEETAHPGAVGAGTATLAVALPYSACLLSLWGVHVRRTDGLLQRLGVPAAVLVVLLVPAASRAGLRPGSAVLLLGVVAALLLASKVRAQR